MKRLYTSASFFLLSAFALYAEYDGRWYSVEDHHHSSSGGVGTVIMFIIGAIATIFLVALILKDKDRENSEKGSLTVFFVVMLIVGFIAMLSLCK